MFAFLEGILCDVSANAAVVNCGGVGYEVMMTSVDTERLPGEGEKVKIHTLMNFNENTGFTLYGFLKKSDLNMFKLLITVNGVGPKAALSILSALSSDGLSYAILGEDTKAISKAPGIGKKTAERIIIDLKDKVSLPEISEHDDVEDSKEEKLKADSQIREDAILALTALGYSRTEGIKAVNMVEIGPDATVDFVLKECLKYLI